MMQGGVAGTQIPAQYFNYPMGKNIEQLFDDREILGRKGD
jgi:hypothetical protein